MISYRNRELLDSIENGRLPDTLSDWLQLDKVKISEKSVKCAIIEKNRDGVVLSTRIIDLKLQAHGHRFDIDFNLYTYNTCTKGVQYM